MRNPKNPIPFAAPGKDVYKQEQRAQFDLEQERQEIRLAPCQIVFAGLGAFVALAAAFTALGAFLVHLH